MKPALMTTTGYVYSKDKKHLKTFASYDDNEESFSDRNVFPIGCIKELKKDRNLIPFPKKKYNIIYSDPAWHFKTYSNKGEKRSAVRHYDCLNINDIYDLPVNTICDDDCVLFMWAIDPMLPEALETIKRWGFKYKTIAFTWAKGKRINT